MLGPHPDLSCCAGVSAHLSELLDGELDPVSTVEAIVHLAACEGCARDAAELARTVEALRGLRRSRAAAGGPLH
jgi:anti-sigma factor RsiW